MGGKMAHNDQACVLLFLIKISREALMMLTMYFKTKLTICSLSLNLSVVNKYV
jgi:hypothetical protein